MQRWMWGMMWGLLAWGLLTWTGRAEAECVARSAVAVQPQAVAVQPFAAAYLAVPQTLVLAPQVAYVPQAVAPQAVAVPLATGTAYGANVLAVPVPQPVAHPATVEVRTVTRRGPFGRTRRVTRRIQR